MPPQTLNSPTPSPSNGSIYKWISGGLASLLMVMVVGWASDVSTLKERTSRLETSAESRSKQLDRISADIDRLEDKVDTKLSEVLDEIRKMHRREGRQ